MLQIEIHLGSFFFLAFIYFFLFFLFSPFPANFVDSFKIWNFSDFRGFAFVFSSRMPKNAILFAYSLLLTFFVSFLCISHIFFFIFFALKPRFSYLQRSIVVFFFFFPLFRSKDAWLQNALVFPSGTLSDHILSSLDYHYVDRVRVRERESVYVHIYIHLP